MPTHMTLLYFVTHPDVLIDPTIPVPDWTLSERGVARMRAFASQPWLSNVGVIFCSNERKATDSAGILSHALRRPYSVVEGLRENDRSATGYLPQREFQETADTFFAHPNLSVRGWERAIDAQRRIVATMDPILGAGNGDCDVVVVSHGGVGALYLCHVKAIPISRAADQPLGSGGNFYVVDRGTRRLLLDWHAID